MNHIQKLRDHAESQPPAIAADLDAAADHIEELESQKQALKDALIRALDRIVELETIHPQPPSTPRPNDFTLRNVDLCED